MNCWQFSSFLSNFRVQFPKSNPASCSFHIYLQYTHIYIYRSYCNKTSLDKTSSNPSIVGGQHWTPHMGFCSEAYGENPSGAVPLAVSNMFKPDPRWSKCRTLAAVLKVVFILLSRLPFRPPIGGRTSIRIIRLTVRQTTAESKHSWDDSLRTEFPNQDYVSLNVPETSLGRRLLQASTGNLYLYLIL